MAAVQQPVHEKLTLLWHNHFATSAQKVRVAAHMAAQNQKLRTLSLGDFRTLAYSMLTDAAMLRWLDGQSQYRQGAQRKPGSRIHGAVRAGPRQRLHRGRRARRGPRPDRMGDRRRRPDLADPQTPRRRRPRRCSASPAISTPPDSATPCWRNPSRRNTSPARLWQQLASDDPPSPQALDRLVSAYGPGRDLRALTRAILTDDEFTGGRASKVNTPVEWLVGVIRTLRVPLDQPAQLQDGRGDVAGTGATAVLPAQRRRLAARPGVAVHRQRRGPAARREPDGPHRRPVRHRETPPPATASTRSAI